MLPVVPIVGCMACKALTAPQKILSNPMGISKPILDHKQGGGCEVFAYVIFNISIYACTCTIYLCCVRTISECQPPHSIYVPQVHTQNPGTKVIYIRIVPRLHNLNSNSKFELCRYSNIRNSNIGDEFELNLIPTHVTPAAGGHTS
jgi:hypothetical protein